MAHLVCVNVVDGQESQVLTKYQNLTMSQASSKARQLNGWLRSRGIEQAAKYFTVVMDAHDVPDTTLEQDAAECHAAVYDGIGRFVEMMPLSKAEALCAEDNDYTCEVID